MEKSSIFNGSETDPFIDNKSLLDAWADIPNKITRGFVRQSIWEFLFQRKKHKENYGFIAPFGKRWESDAEFRARIKQQLERTKP